MDFHSSKLFAIFFLPLGVPLTEVQADSPVVTGDAYPSWWECRRKIKHPEEDGIWIASGTNYKVDISNSQPLCLHQNENACDTFLDAVLFYFLSVTKPF